MTSCGVSNGCYMNVEDSSETRTKFFFFCNEWNLFGYNDDEQKETPEGKQKKIWWLNWESLYREKEEKEKNLSTQRKRGVLISSSSWSSFHRTCHIWKLLLMLYMQQFPIEMSYPNRKEMSWAAMSFDKWLFRCRVGVFARIYSRSFC